MTSFIYKQGTYEEFKVQHAYINMKWRTNDGEVLLIREMDISHIHNCISLLKRRKIEALLKDIPVRKKADQVLERFEYELSLRPPLNAEDLF